jgi:hypothetical protein
MKPTTNSQVQVTESPASYLYEKWQATLQEFAPQADTKRIAHIIGLLADAVDDELIGCESDHSADRIRENPVEWHEIQTRAKLRSELSGYLSEISGHEE